MHVEFLVQYGRVGRSIRSGIRMRLSALPGGVDYSVRGEPMMPARFNEYGISISSTTKGLLRILFDNLMQLRADVFHAFFWWYRRMGDNWILENDQSLSQFLRMSGGLGRVPRFLSSFTYGRATVITWTNWAKLGFIGDGFPEESIHVIDLPVWPQWIKLERKIDNSIIFVGIDFHLKGGDVALGVFKYLKERWGSSVRTIYIGSIPDVYRNQLKYVDEYLPPSPSSTVLDRIGKSKVLLLPSRWEAYGITAVEAMMRGTAVVSSKAGGLGEVVEGAGTACGDASCMAEAAEDLLTSPSTWKSQVNRQLESLVGRHSPNNAMDSLSKVYESFMRR